MVALTRNPILPADQHARALEVLQSPHLSFEDAAQTLGLTLDQLTLFVTSSDGLALIARAELAAAVRIRAMAAAQLHAVVDALSMMLQDYASSVRNVPSSDAPRAQELNETKRQNARRAGHLLFRIAHFTPRPIRAYEPREAETSETETPTTPAPTTTSTPRQATLPPSPQPESQPKSQPALRWTRPEDPPAPRPAIAGQPRPTQAVPSTAPP